MRPAVAVACLASLLPIACSMPGTAGAGGASVVVPAPPQIAAEALPEGIDAAQLRFEPLFDGSTLEGWVNVNGAPSTWTARDGMIVCSGVPTGVLRTERMYQNFVVDFEWRHMVAGGNGGFFVWSDALPATGVPFTRSIEVQVMDGVETPDYTSDGDVFSIHGAHMTPDRPHPSGWERCLPSERRVLPSPAWNHYTVTCRNGSLQLAVNGRIVSGGSGIAPRRGYLCLESEGSEAHYRNLRIAELPTPRNLLPPDQVAQQDEGYVSLYDGVTLDGWKPLPVATPGKAADAVAWQARDWTLYGSGSGGDLSTSALFGDFDLSIDWRRVVESKLPEELPVAFGKGWLLAGLAETAPGHWNRLRVSRRGGTLSLDFPDHGMVLKAPVAEGDRPVPIVLRAQGGAIEFANLFVKPAR